MMNDILNFAFVSGAVLAAALIRARLKAGADRTSFRRLFPEQVLPWSAAALFGMTLLRLSAGLKDGIIISVVPDAVEYCWGALRLAEGERFGISLNGVWYPSRYSPLMSAVLWPFVKLAGGTVLGAGICAALATCLALFFLWYALEKQNFRCAALLALAGALLFPGVLHCGGMAMTEPVYMALLAAMLACFAAQVTDDSASVSWGRITVYALAAGLCGALRSTGYVMLPPFLLLLWARMPRKQFSRLLLAGAVLILPSCLTLLFSCGFNWSVFGSPFRSGYHFHCPVPYEFPELLFKLAYIPANFRLVWQTERRALAMLAGALLFSLAYGVFLFRNRGKKGNAGLWIWGWVMWHFFCCLGLYLPHFYFAMRFFVPAAVLLIWLAARGAEEMIPAGLPRRTSFRLGVGAAALLLGFCGAENQPLDYDGCEIASLRYCARVLPGDALLVHDADPGRAEIFFRRHTGRRQIPARRDWGYAAHTGLARSLDRKPDFPCVMGSPELAAFIKAAPGSVVFFPRVWEKDWKAISAEAGRKGGLFVTTKALMRLTPEQFRQLKQEVGFRRVGSAPKGDGVFRILPRHASGPGLACVRR